MMVPLSFAKYGGDSAFNPLNVPLVGNPLWITRNDLLSTHVVFLRSGQ